MPREGAIPGSPEDWLARAKSNLAFARMPKPTDGLWEDHCFQVHQAAEKAIKGVYQSHGWIFEYVHDIDRLWKGLEKKGLSIPPEIREAVRLSKYSYETRYPGLSEPVTEVEYHKALGLAEAVVAWAEKIIHSPGAFEAPAAYAAQPKHVRKAQVVSPSMRVTYSGFPKKGSNHRAGKARVKKRKKK